VSGLRDFWQIDQDGVKVPDTELHDMVLADNWDSVVAPEDTVWILGDLSINSGPQVAVWMQERPGIKHLISGNHDKTHPMFGRKVAATSKEWEPLFESIQIEAQLVIAGRKVTLSHFPYWSWGDGPGKEAYSRYKEWRPKETRTSILLHGHTHGTERAHERSLHVGLDAWDLQLVPLSTVEEFVLSLN